MVILKFYAVTDIYTDVFLKSGYYELVNCELQLLSILILSAVLDAFLSLASNFIPCFLLLRTEDATNTFF